ncbi:MAG: SOS response-associated peptidase [Gammaproteobacteria bacterium]|nr:MAG: SOS response-associated peptidase [Gammaproteobacteria bacterium]
MCGRINVSADPLAELYLELLDQKFSGEDRYNVAPTEQVSVIRRSREGGLVARDKRWWLTPYWSKELSTRYSMFNAKSETLESSRAYREPFLRRRCVVPISGFYEWLKDGERRLPYYIRPAGNEGLLLAGLWDRWRGADEVVESFTIITTAVHDRLAFIHNRQPVILRRADLECWLDEASEPEQLRELLTTTLPTALLAIPVSTYVSNSRNEGPRCIEPIAAAVEVSADP